MDNLQKFEDFFEYWCTRLGGVFKKLPEEEQKNYLIYLNHSFVAHEELLKQKNEKKPG